MAKNKLAPTDLDDEVYEFEPGFGFKLGLIAFVIFVISFFSNFTIRESLENLIANNLQKSASCPLLFSGIEVSFFLPSLKIKNLELDGSCFSNPFSTVELGDVNTFLYGPSFSPFGLKFKTEITKGRTALNIYSSLGFGSSAIRIEESVIDSSILNSILGPKLKLAGTFNIDTVIYLQKFKLNSGNFLIKSNSLIIPNQKVAAFDLPNLAIQNFVFKAHLKQASSQIKNLDIMTLELGSNESPLIAQVKGAIKLNDKYMQGSDLNLRGKVKFSQSFLESFSILNLFLTGKQADEDGYFPLTISGTLGAPKPSLQ